MGELREPTDIYAIAFACTPNAGSEAGVGWQFARALAKYATDHGVRLTIVTSSPHARTVRSELMTRTGPSHGTWRIVALPVPRRLLESRHGSVQRLTYFAWAVAAVICIAVDASMVYFIRAGRKQIVVHHLTYATEAVPTIERLLRAHAAWIMGPAGSTARRSGNALFDARYALRHRLRRVLMKANLQADLMIATNHDVAELWANTKGARAEPVTEPNILLDGADFPASIAWGKRSYDVSIVGILATRKRVDVALRAAAWAASAQNQTLAVVVIGTGPEQDRLRRLGASFSNLHVTFAGHLSRQEALVALASSRTLVHAAIQEGSPWVIGEAQALRVRPVVFPHSGADTIVSLGGEGVVADDSSEQALGQALVTALGGGEPAHTDRWDASRLATLLPTWYSAALKRRFPGPAT